MILILPTVMAQAISVYIFYERHLDHVSRQLSLSLSAEIATVADYVENAKTEEDKQKYMERAVVLFGFSPKIMTVWQAKNHTAGLSKINHKEYESRLRARIKHPVDIYSDQEKVITTIVYFGDKALVIDTPYKRLINSTSQIFIWWMTGITTILLVVSILFLKNQIRPIARLARLADNFGRGHDVTYAYKPEGAHEVRQAFKAFINMQQRISRFVKQRTEMLAGISHDLRTPLTRIKLELALQKDKPEFVNELEKDILELETMITSYIEFVRGDEGEEATQQDIAAVLEDVVKRYKSKKIKLNAAPVTAYIRPNSMKRVFKNVIDNALKYGKNLRITAAKDGEFAVIEFEDDGTGIPADKREDVFKPFYRMEKSRNLETGGIGLGLSIVRDIVNSHGGTVSLEDSEKPDGLGGLKLIIKLSV